MPKRLVFVQDNTGSIVFETVYDDMNTMLDGIKVLSDQAMYGADCYRIVIQIA